jgi:hypothetical protein
MPTTTPNFGWSVPVSTDLVKDGATAIELLGDSIDTSLVDLLGGTTGQVLAKASGTDLDFSWVAVDPLLILDAKGDLISATAADTPARLAVGANGTVLTADSAEATGLKWAALANPGKILQVVGSSTATQVDSATNSYVDTGLTVTITPTLATSKILVLISQNGLAKNATSASSYGTLQLLRGATQVALLESQFAFTNSAVENNIGSSGATYLDAPATTSALTYKTQFKNTGAAGIIRVQVDNALSSITVLEIGA